MEKINYHKQAHQLTKKWEHFMKINREKKYLKQREFLERIVEESSIVKVHLFQRICGVELDENLYLG